MCFCELYWEGNLEVFFCCEGVITHAGTHWNVFIKDSTFKGRIKDGVVYVGVVMGKGGGYHALQMKLQLNYVWSQLEYLKTFLK